MAGITLDRSDEAFGGVRAVDGRLAEIADGEFLVLVGPSGCGKSTLLRMIAGLEDVTAGGSRSAAATSPTSRRGARDIAMVFQTLRPLPAHERAPEHRLRAEGAPRTPKPEIARRVADVAELLGLADLLDRRPAQLSGGQRQRVAMGRAIVRAAAGVPARRAALEPRREASRRHARIARAAAPAARRHDGLRHARPDRGDDARPARRGDARRPHPAVRQPAGALRATRRPLHRSVHRLAGDEPGRGDRSRRRASASGSTACPLARSARPPRLDRVVLGHPARGASTTRRSRGACRRSTSTGRGARGTRLRRAHLLPPSMRRRSPPRRSRSASDGGLPARPQALFTARVDPRTPARVGDVVELAVDAAPLPLLRPGHRRAARPPTVSPELAGAAVTKQSETRERVLELIEALEVGERDPLGAAARHRPRRLAPDRARRARRARARGLPRAPARRGDVRRRAEGREGHGHLVVQRRHARRAA